jgi:hypothetical protein
MQDEEEIQTIPDLVCFAGIIIAIKNYLLFGNVNGI